MWPRLFVSLLALAAGERGLELLQRSLQLSRKPASTCQGWDCLKQFVSAPDGAFAWRDTGRRLKDPAWEGQVLELISQRWLPDLVTPALWNHTLVLITPKAFSAALSDAPCVLYVALGSLTAPQTAWNVEAADAELQAAAQVAHAAGAWRAAVLFNVPANFLRFGQAAPSVEDGSLSTSWALLRQDPAPRMLELPMAKATVRAMDVLGAFAGIHSFALMGTSKRGHLCWHTASVDARVKAIVPIAKALNLEPQLRLTVEELGGFPWAAFEYVSKGLFQNFTLGPHWKYFLGVTDAYYHLSRTKALPKLVISASSDDFFMPDHLKLWWPQVPEPKWSFTVPNSRHIIGGLQVTALAPVIGSFLARVKSQAMPRLEWSVEEASGAISAWADEPSQVRLWQATSCDNKRMDFRQYSAKAEVCPCGVPSAEGCRTNVTWTSSELPDAMEPDGPESTGKWWVRPKDPRSGRWRAFFLEFEWPGGLRLSTEVSVVPRTVPFPDCPGSGKCEGLV
ncbi:unnamed protein product [Effrenium voratum]|nr:unnamed protein product [Effrenium voratum]